MENAVDIGMILRFGLKCLGIFTLIFLGAVFTPKIAEAIDKWKAEHFKKNSVQHPETKEEISVRSIYELPPKPEQHKKKAVIRKKK